MSSRLRAEFTPQELAAVLARYDLGTIETVDQHFKGSRRSPKAIVKTDRGRFLLKRRARGRDHPMKVAYAHGIQRFLAERDFPLPRLMPSRIEDDTMVIHGGHIYEVFEYLEGGSYDRSVEATFDAGFQLARFHEIVADFQFDWEPTRRAFHDANVVRNHLNAIPASVGKNDSVAGRESELFSVVSILYDSYETACEQVEDAGYAEWPIQTIHGDWHPGNMLFSDQSVLAVIDYDSLHLLPPVVDVANGVLQFSILGGDMDPRLWPAELDNERFCQFLSGYEEHRTIEPDQVRVLTALMIEALIAEAVAPIAATGSFGRLEGFRFMKMICRKVRWLKENGDNLLSVWQA